MGKLERFIESIYIDNLNYKQKSLEESQLLTESKDGNKYKSVGVYEVIVSKCDVENLNGRIYPKSLWENVIKNQKYIYEGCVGLMDHPNDDGSTKDIFCVWHNLHLDGNDVKADMYLVGDHGRNIKEVLDAGGRIGLSSSGLGELIEGTNKVNPDTYVIERISDAVINPSFSLYVTKENIKENIKNEKENITIYNIKEKQNKEDTIMDKSITIPINLLRKQIENYVENASNEVDLNKKLSLYNEIKEWIQEASNDKLNDLEEKVDNEIKIILEKKEELSIKGQKTDSLEEELIKSKNIIESLQKELFESNLKLDLCYEQLDNIKNYSNKYKEMFDIQTGKLNTMIEAEDFLKEKRLVEKLEKEKKILFEKIENLKKDSLRIKEEFNNYVKKVEKERLEEQKRKELIKKKKLKEKIEKELEEKKKSLQLQKVKIDEERKKEEELDRLQQRSEVKSYYLDLCQNYGKSIMENFKEDILSCRTLKEAQIKVLKLRSLIEDMVESNKQTYLDEDIKSFKFKPQERSNSLL